MKADIVDGILAFLGAGMGSALAFWATHGATKAESEARRREEWGRRFTTALGALTSADRVSRATGRALLRELLDSELASDDDRKAAEAVLDAAATHSEANLRLLLPGNVDDIQIVRDTGANDEPEGGAR